jgi:FKBP-type peptidyl-prolyl cis-trans isomerase SlyD
MTISENKVVAVSYTLKITDGQVVDQATAERPFAYIHGGQQVLPAFETNLQGLGVGADFDFKLSAVNGYGEYEQDYVHEFDRKMFAEVPADMLDLGRIMPMQDQFGNPMDGEIVEINENVVVLDFNHPLAGEELHFTGKILEIREASEEELAHGHVHGAHGVQH